MSASEQMRASPRERSGDYGVPALRQAQGVLSSSKDASERVGGFAPLDEARGALSEAERAGPTPPEQGDETHTLVEAARQGDQVAFAALYARFARTVHGILLSRVPRPDVEDLVQDVFVTALQELPSLRDPAAFGGWVSAIARHRAVDHLRRAPRTTELPRDLASAEADRTEAWLVMAAIRGLPDAYRETLTLRLVEGMTGPEIAACTGLTEGSVRVNLHRGMKQLRERLERRRL